MTSEITSKTNVKQAVPFFNVKHMESSLHFYVDGLGFEMKNHWMNEGKLRWCWLQLGGASVMLQEYHHTQTPPAELGKGMSICFMCEDALAIYHEAKARGLQASEPFVGNGMWVTSLADPDGYKIEFESVTDVPEGTMLSETV